MKVALVYDRVNKFGGAERVLISLQKIFPDAPLFTLVHNQKTSPWAREFVIKPTFFNQIKFLRNRHELLAPFSAMAFETFDFSSYDVVISVTSADAKAVITKPQTLHICYCLTPTRYLWSGKDYYRIPNLLLNWAQRADIVYASRPDEYLAISNEVKKRINDFYHKQSDVVYPPINYKFFSDIQKNDNDYYLLAGRLVPYKKPEIVIHAFNKLKRKLVIAGTGRELENLKSLAGKTINFVGQVNDLKLRDLYAGAKAVISPQEEDFGLVPLEAQAAGTPVLAFAAGGALETIVDQQTGLFFNQQNEDSIIETINRFEAGKHQITSKKCRKQASRFSEDRFIGEFSAKVNSLYEIYSHSRGPGQKNLAIKSGGKTKAVSSHSGKNTALPAGG